MNQRICYISQGRLFIKSPEGAEDEILSEFAGKLKQRLQSVEDRNNFRGGGSGASFMRGGFAPPNSVTVEDTFRCNFSCAAAGASPGIICYGLNADGVRGLFIYETGEKYERRVQHGPKHIFSGISARMGEDGQEWIIAAAQDHGVSRIARFLPEEGGGLSELTEGDAIDSNPMWEAEGRRFVYQSSGIARHPQNGEWMGLGPASIHRIDLDSGRMEVIAEDDRYDYLCPHPAPDGSIYYLRRPYEAIPRVSFLKHLQDIVLFPFRLARALFGFLNVFSMIFSNKPLRTAGQPKFKGPDPKAMFLHGRLIQINKAMRDTAADDLTAIVPGNWQLVHRDTSGTETTIVSGVLAFSLAKDGGIIYSNGKGVFKRPKGSQEVQKISNQKYVTSVFEMNE